MQSLNFVIGLLQRTVTSVSGGLSLFPSTGCLDGSFEVAYCMLAYTCTPYAVRRDRPVVTPSTRCVYIASLDKFSQKIKNFLSRGTQYPAGAACLLPLLRCAFCGVGRPALIRADWCGHAEHLCLTFVACLRTCIPRRKFER